MLDHVSQMQEDMHDLANELERIRNILDEPRTWKLRQDFVAARLAEEEAQAQAETVAKMPARRKRVQAPQA
jgi:regulator of replication initiation timing